MSDALRFSHWASTFEKLRVFEQKQLLDRSSRVQQAKSDKLFDAFLDAHFKLKAEFSQGRREDTFALMTPKTFGAIKQELSHLPLYASHETAGDPPMIDGVTIFVVASWPRDKLLFGYGPMRAISDMVLPRDLDQFLARHSVLNRLIREIDMNSLIRVDIGANAVEAV